MRTVCGLLLATICSAPMGPLSAQERPIDQLAWLVGEWDFEDVQLEGEYREAGTRTCDWALGGDYIACESHGVDHRGGERSYIWYFNYNDREERFEVASLFEGFPRKLLFSATVHDEGHRLELTFGAWEADGLVFEGGATVTYNGSDEYVWTNGRFRDVVTRRQ